MRKNISQNPSFFTDVSNHSIADIVMQTSSRYQCAICKAFNSSQELVELCKCEDPVHETCMTQIIDDWIESQSSKSNVEISTNAKPFNCSECQSEVFYKSKNKLLCRNLTGIYKFVKQQPSKSIFQVIFFLIGIGCLIFGVLIKLEKISFYDGMNPLTSSIIAIAIIIVSSLVLFVSFYFIFVDILTQKRRKVVKIYQKNKKTRRRTSQTIPVIRIS